MWSKFCKNTILQGTVDFYCLACEFLLHSEEDAQAHIEKPIHRKNFDKTSYVASCPGDNIRKVNKGYYCEHCNVYITTMTKVKLHQADEEHIFNKSDDSERTSKPSFLKWVRNAIIAFDDLLIDEGTWNGFIDDTCVSCDTEYGDRELHRSDTQHVLRVMQSRVHIAADNSISRKIDDSTYQCLTCNTIVAANSLPAHFDTPAHKKRYLECRKLKRSWSQVSNGNADSNKGKENKTDAKGGKVEAKNGKSEGKDRKNEAKEGKDEVKDNKNEAKESITKETKTKSEKKATEEPIIRPKKEIPIEFTADMNKVLGTTDYMEIDGNSVYCYLCGWKMHRDMAYIHVVDVHHKTMENLQKGRNEKMKEKFQYKECDDKKKTKPKTQPKNEKDEVKPEKDCDDKKESKPRTQQKIEKAEAKSGKENDDKKENKLKTQPKNETEVKVEAKIDEEENKSKILDSIQIFQKNDVLIDLISEKALCKKCSLTLNYTFADIETHIKDHKEKKVGGEKCQKYIDDSLIKTWTENTKKEKSNNTIKDEVEADNNNNKEKVSKPPKQEAEVQEKMEEAMALVPIFPETVKEEKPEKQEKTPKKQKEVKPAISEDDPVSYAANNNLTYNRDFNKAYCRICDTKIPSSIKSMKEHVNGNNHKAKASQNQPKVADMRPPSPQYRTKRMEEFVNSVVILETNFQVDAIVNRKFAISVISLLMITKNDYSALRCHVCEKSLVPNEVDEHSKTRKHSRAMESTPVVDGLDDEFIREVRPGIFHCGYCNLVEAGWETIQRHMNCTQHYRNKLSSSWRLEESLPVLRHHEAREQLHMMVFMRMLMGNMRFF